MTKRRQVLLDEEELADIRRIARVRHMTVAEWVRQALRRARRQEPESDSSKKLASIRAAAHHTFQTADIDVMLEEIERGYTVGGDRRSSSTPTYPCSSLVPRILTNQTLSDCSRLSSSPKSAW